MSKRSGSSLGMVIVTLTLGTLILFFSLSAGLQQMEWSSQLQLKARARDAAESMIQLAMAKLCKDPTFGQGHAAGSVLRCGPPGLADDCTGLVSFDTQVAAAAHIPVSTNNLASSASALADGRTIPNNSCHLVALGTCFSQKIQIETVYIQPPFPSGCASSGPVKLKSVRLWGLPPNQVPSSPLLPDPSVPAHVYTNSPSATGLDIGPGCEILGNAACAGGILKDPSARVTGELQPYSKANPVPHFDVAGMFSSIQNYIGQVPYLPGQPVESYCVVGNSLTIGGDCELHGGVLAVRGDLQVNGQLKGNGFVLVTGNVIAGAGASLQAEDKLALLSGGNLTLAGQNATTYTFNGLVYAQGDIKAHDLTVLGTLVSDTPNGTGKIELERVDVVQTDVSVNGGVATPAPGQVIGGQRAAVLSAKPDPLNPAKQIYIGSLSWVSGQKLGANVFPRIPEQNAWMISFAPTEAIITRYGAGGAMISQTTDTTYVGSQTPLFTSTEPDPGWAGPGPTRGARFLQNTDMGRILTKHITDSTAIEKVSDNAGQMFWNLSRITGPTAFHLDLNNLVPSVDRVRLVTWVESTPTR